MDTLFGEQVETRRVKHKANGYAAPPGTGPAGETCRTCKHACYVSTGCAKYHKCELMRSCWTSSYGTDIRLKSPACRLWEKVEDSNATANAARASRVDR